MKQNIKITHFILLVSLALCSCETYHFASPLPIDSKNIYKTPKQFSGLTTEGESGLKGYKLEKDYITLTGDQSIKIINGIWIDPRDTSSIQKSDTIAWKKLVDSRKYESLFSIQFDSLKRPVDTVRNYVIKGSKIYFIKNSELSPGFPYVLEGDTIRAIISQFHFIELGPNAFFRKVTSNFYILNLRENEVFNDNNSDDFLSRKHWWQVLLISKGKDGNVTIHYWEDVIKKDPSLITSLGDNYYYNSQWTKKDILRLVNEGAFESMD